MSSTVFGNNNTRGLTHNQRADRRRLSEEGSETLTKIDLRTLRRRIGDQIGEPEEWRCTNRDIKGNVPQQGATCEGISRPDGRVRSGTRLEE